MWESACLMRFECVHQTRLLSTIRMFFFVFISLCFCVQWAHMANNHTDTPLMWFCYAKEGEKMVGGKDFRLPWSIVVARTVAFACLLHTFESTNWYEMHSLHHPQTYWLHSPRIQINCCLSMRALWWLTHDLLNWNKPENWQPKTEIESRLGLHICNNGQVPSCISHQMSCAIENCMSS